MNDQVRQADISRKSGIFFATLIVAIGGIIYEMIIGTTASYLLGNSVLNFSLAIGFFLTGMGIGSYLSGFIGDKFERNFVLVEVALGVFGGFSVLILFTVFAYTEFFYLVFILLVIGIGALIGTEIPLLLGILKNTNREEMLKLTTRILSIDYFGALIASLAFPLILLPQIGLLNTAFVVGLINLGVALLMLVSFENEIKSKFVVGAVLVFGAVLLVTGIVAGGAIDNFISRALYQDEVIYSAQSEYQAIVMTKFNNDVRLFLNGNIQFSSVDEYRYHEPLVQVPLAYSQTEVADVLVLGGGDGLVARELLRSNPDVEITLVDLDPAVTELATTHNLLIELNQASLSDDRVEVINQDAFNFLQQTENLYQLIIIDLPDPNEESLAKLYTREFYALARRRITPAGIMITQATSPYFTNQTFWTVEHTVADQFEHTLPFHTQVPSFGDWGFVMASDIQLELQDDFEFNSENRFIQNIETIESLQFFDADSDYPDEQLQISTLLDPQILYKYDEEVRMWQ